jgi:hypothetical protein
MTRNMNGLPHFPVHKRSSSSYDGFKGSVLPLSLYCAVLKGIIQISRVKRSNNAWPTGSGHLINFRMVSSDMCARPYPSVVRQSLPAPGRSWTVTARTRTRPLSHGSTVHSRSKVHSTVFTVCNQNFHIGETSKPTEFFYVNLA